MNVLQFSLGLFVVLALLSVGSTIKCYQCMNNECATQDANSKGTSSPNVDPNSGNGTTPTPETTPIADSHSNSGNRTARAADNSTETSDPSYDTISDTTSDKSCDCADITTLTSFECGDDFNACVLSRTDARNIHGEIIGEVIRRECGKLDKSKEEECEFSDGFNGESITCYCKSDDCNGVAGLQASWMLVLSVAAIFVSLRN